MKVSISGGIYPTMLVAYTSNDEIDYAAIAQLIEWYIAEGVHGIFALCHSTEIHCLSLRERLSLAKFVLTQVDGRVPVVLGGVTADTLSGQLEEAPLFAALNPDALVLISNRLCDPDGNGMVENMKKLMDVLPADLPLGIYECPQPYKRIVRDDELSFMAKSGRVSFIKDTCCDTAQMRRRAELVKGTPLKLFNANCATLLETLRFGYHGFSGIMANFHPALYAWLYSHQEDRRADTLSQYLAVTSIIEMRCYPIPAKRYLHKYVGLSITDLCRSVADQTVPALSAELEGVYQLTRLAHELIGLPTRKYDDPRFISYDGRKELQTVVDQDPGVYLGHPTTCMLPDGKTVFAIYPKSHGFGQLVLKKSTDGGKSWSDRLPVPDSFSTGLECPTIYRMEDAFGKSRLFIFSGRYPFRVSVSEDDGESFSEFTKIGNFGGYFISTVIPFGKGKYMALFHDEGAYIKGGRDFKGVIYRAGSGTDVRTQLYTYKSPDHGISYEEIPIAYRFNPTVERYSDRWEKIYESHHRSPFTDRHFELYSIVTEDGGLTWSAPNLICTHPTAKLCEPWAVRSPDGNEIAVFLRDNSRKHNSFVIRSRDDGRTWSAPTQLCDGLTGDRHVAVYLPDGRLFVTLRDMKPGSILEASWVAWVGSYADAVSGRDGDCRILMKRNYGPYSDCAYPALEICEDGTILATSYGRWIPGNEPFILSFRLSREELNAIPCREEKAEPLSALCERSPSTH